jgi:hypothetical protein
VTVSRETLRIKVLGGVSCREATRLTRTYFADMASGRCGRANNFCDLELPGGWSCSLFFVAESREAGGAGAGCARGSARVRIYRGGHAARTSSRQAGSDVFLAADPGRSCGTVPPQGNTRPGQRVRVLRGDVSCREARSVFLALARGMGTEYGPGIPLSKDYETYRGWRCAGGMEVLSCERGPKINSYGERRQVIFSKSLPESL